MSATAEQLTAALAECRRLIDTRFPDGSARGAAAVLLEDGTILTGTSPDFVNGATVVCHETEPYCAAFRLDRRIVASVCLQRFADGRYVVLSPCGVCRERLAGHGPDVLVAVPTAPDPSEVQWVTLRDALPHYWVAAAYPDEVPAWR